MALSAKGGTFLTKRCTLLTPSADLAHAKRGGSRALYALSIKAGIVGGFEGHGDVRYSKSHV